MHSRATRYSSYGSSYIIYASAIRVDAMVCVCVCVNVPSKCYDIARVYFCAVDLPSYELRARRRRRRHTMICTVFMIRMFYCI